MELVRGIPITEYCDKNQLPPKERLELFMTVCQAIQHAHQKGIIHRDIKPSNVLVTSHDGKPVAKVIDFGVAKAIHQHLTERTIYTNFAQMVGTPLYMSPEQAEMSGLDVDTRSDIYSLGVLLYELLTGTTPLEKKRFAKAAYDEIRRLIRDEEPPKPSTRLSTSDSIVSIAAQRQMEPAKLSKLIRGDLDWITMKCLEKDRTRRYETANGLARDVEHYLRDEPVEACPPSATYRLRKFAKKNRAALTTAATIAVLLVAGIAMSAWQAVRATQAERDAQAAKKQAETNEQKALAAQASEANLRKGAEANEKKAETEATRSAEVAKFMRDMLKGVGPSVALGRDTKLLREILDQTAGRLNDLKVQPEVESDLCVTLGAVYRDLGDYPKAEAMLQQALVIRKKLFGEKSLEVAAVLDLLGQVLHRNGKPDEAEVAYRQALAAREELAGHESLQVASSLNHLGSLLRNQNKRDEAEAKLREGLALRKRLLSPNDPEIANSLSDLGIVLGAQGKADEAEPLHREALAIRKARFPADHPQIADSLGQLGGTLELRGKYAEAETNILAALAIHQKVLGDHRDTANALTRLGSVLVKQNRLPEAEQRFREALAMRNKVFGESETSDARLIDVLKRQGKQTEVDKLLGQQLAAWDGKSKENRPPLKMANTLISNGRALFYAGKPDEGEAAYRQAMEIRRSYSGDDPRGLLKSLAGHLRKAGRDRQAETANREVLALETKLHGRESTNAVIAMYAVALDLNSQRKSAEAESMLREARAVQLRLKLNDRYIGAVLEALGVALRNQGKLVEAEALFREALTNANTTPDTEYWVRDNLGILLERQRRFAEAETVYRGAVELRNKQKSVPQSWPWSVDRLADVLEIQGKHAEAEALFREQLASRMKQAGDTDPAVNRWRNNLIRCLQIQGKLAEAQALIREVVVKSGKPEALNALAWELATSPDPEMRDGPNAVACAEKAVAATGRKNATFLNTLAAAYAEAGKFDKAVAAEHEAITLVPKNQSVFFVQCLALYEASIPYHDPGRLAAQVNLLLSTHKFAAAEPFAREYLRLREKVAPDDWTTFYGRSVLGGSLLGQKKYAEAEPLLLKGYDGIKKREKQLPTAVFELRRTEAADRLIELYTATNKQDDAKKWQAERAKKLDTPLHADELGQLAMIRLREKKWTDAEPILRESLAIQEENLLDDWTTFSTRSMLGGALLGQKKYAEAEPLLLKGYEGMKQRENKIPEPAKVRLAEAVDRLIEFYTATKKPDEVKKWQAERAKYPDVLKHKE
jgi:tetratricopeptide (TPR) repeat protein